MEDLFIWASFQGQELNLSSEITKYNDPSLGSCFTFNGINSSTSYSTDSAGEDFGFQALMKVREDEYLPWTKLAALQVFIHARDEIVFSDSQRHFAEPGLVSQFVISSTVYARLGGIYGACVNDTSEVKSYYYPGKYTNYGCVLSCYQNVVHLMCGCTDPRYLGIDDPKIKVCPLSKGSCVLNVTATLGDPYTWSFCDCPVSCNDTQYSVLWYSSEFSINPAECLTSNSGTSSQSCKQEISDRAMISVFFGLNSQLSFEETPSMNINEYISLFGGVTGIIAGFCIISVVEFSFLVYRVLLTFCTNESVSLDEAGVQGDVDDEANF
uniref:Sodium channel protein Nach n=1 Tax=Ditylenchus dipsaci TaxID=166011 RepID=A0A915CLG5_9BILA